MAINYELINQGSMSVGGGFTLLSKNPLDARLVIPAFEGLQNLIDNGAAYAGMITYVTSEKRVYEVYDDEGTLKYRPLTLTEDEIKAFIPTEDELKELIGQQTTAAMEFKGVTATLPENPAKGDLYKVAGENIDIEIDGVAAVNGDSVVYDGENWYLIPSGDDIEDTWRIIKVAGVSLGGLAEGKTLNLTAGDKLDVELAEDGTVTYKHEAVVAPEDKGAKWVDVTTYGSASAGTYKIIFSDDYMNSPNYTILQHVSPHGDQLYSAEDENVDIKLYCEGLVVDGGWNVGFSYDSVGAPVGRELEVTVPQDSAYEFEGQPIIDTHALQWNTAQEGITVYKKDTSSRTYITGVETDGFGHITGYTTATETVVDTNTTYEFECQVGEGEHTNVFFKVKSSESDQEQEICLDAYSKNEIDEKYTELETHADDLFYSADQDIQLLDTLVNTNKETWDLAGTAVQEAAFTEFKTANNEAIGAAKKAGEDAAAAVDQKLTAYETAHKDDYTNTQIDDAISTVTGNLGTMSTKDANDYLTKVQIESTYATDVNAQKYANDARDAAIAHANGLTHKDTTYTVAPTTNALEFTVTPSEGEAQTVKLVAPTVDVGVTKVTAGTDIVVTPEAGTGEVTVAHKDYSSGTLTKDPSTLTEKGDAYVFTGIELSNGHVTGGTMKGLADILSAMEFILDCGSSAE